MSAITPGLPGQERLGPQCSRYVAPDALPELEVAGYVESISDLYEEKFGDVTYTTKITLTEDDPRLRWGMTVVVRFAP